MGPQKTGSRGIIFVDLRDRTGIVQVVFSPDIDEVAFVRAEPVRAEYVLAIRGVVRKRPEGTENPNMATGEIEVAAREIVILNVARALPFIQQRPPMSMRL